MSQLHARRALLRTRWSAIGAAVAVTLGAGGLSMAQAAIDTGDRPVTVTIAAERILDTRTNLGLSGRFVDGAPRDLQVTGSVPTASGGSKTVVPADAVGVIVNVTVVGPTHEGFLSLRPQGATGEPTTSTVNFFPGAIEPNGATVDLNDGKIQIWVETASDTGTAEVLIDVVGYTIGHNHDDEYYKKSESDEMYGVGHVAYKYGTTETSTTSDAFSDITDAEVTVTTKEEGHLLITFSTQTKCMDNDEDNNCSVRVLVDGTAAMPAGGDSVIFDKGRDFNVDALYQSHSHQWVYEDLSAGDHTVQVQYKNSDGIDGEFFVDEWTLSVMPLHPVPTP